MSIDWNDAVFDGENTVAIYGLIDPVTNTMRYVGQTTNPESRLRQHMDLRGAQCNPDKARWIQTLLAEGLEAKMYIFAAVPKQYAYILEMVTMYIVKAKLTNRVQPTEAHMRRYLRVLAKDERWAVIVEKLQSI